MNSRDRYSAKPSPYPRPVSDGGAPAEPAAPRRRRLIAATMAVGMPLIGAASAVRASSYPDRPIRLIVPWAPGGSTDAIARALAQRTTESMKTSVVVDNRPGAAGQIGTEAAARSAPDGYTLTIVELPHAIAPAVVAKLPYDLLRDFTPVTMVGTSPLVLFATPGRGDARAFLKASAAGTPPAIAHSGSGTVSHLAGELLAQRTRVKFNFVPYRGSAPALTDVAAGTVAAHFATLASGASLMGTGKIAPLAVTSARRVDAPGLRDVPTLAELGLRDMEIEQWWAVVAPATTPIDVVERIRAELVSALGDVKVVERLSSLGVALKGSTRDELRGFMRSEAQRWQAVAKAVGLTPQ